jgi:hypothetical protein
MQINHKNALPQFLLCQALHAHEGDSGEVPAVIEHQACFTFGLEFPCYVEAVKLVQSVMGPNHFDASDYPINVSYNCVVQFD